MHDFFQSGLVADVILVVMVTEAALLLVYRRATGRGIPPADVAAMLFAGACLVLALRAALTGSHWTVVASFLVAALIAHLTDLYRRWSGRLAGKP